jgi:hypothetical protein
MKRTIVTTAAVVSAALGLAAIAAGANAANAAVSRAAAPSWHFVKTPTQGRGASTVVATGKTSGFAFEGDGLGRSLLLERTGATSWKQVKSPVERFETVNEAEATSPKNVYAFTQLTGNSGSRILQFNGSKWTVLKTFGRVIGSATVLSSDDIWVFGGPVNENGLPGVYHYNGHTWRISMSGLGDGDALSDTDVYAIGNYGLGTSVGYYNGSRWTSVNLAGLLPKKTKSVTPTLNGIVAESPDNVYAIDGGSAGTPGDPLVILHYNGSKWSKVATYDGGQTSAAVADGAGGLWIGGNTQSGSSVLLHYSGGKLAIVASPKYDGHQAYIEDFSRIPGTAEELAGGLLLETRASADAILEYS